MKKLLISAAALAMTLSLAGCYDGGGYYNGYNGYYGGGYYPAPYPYYYGGGPYVSGVFIGGGDHFDGHWHR